MLRTIYRQARGTVLQRVIPASGRKLDPAAPVEVIGYLSRVAGIGESARLCARALAAAGHPVRLCDVSPADQDSADIAWHPPAAAAAPPGVRIFHLNPPLMPRGILASGPLGFYRSFNIGYWAWELETVPPEWIAAARYVNAILVPSNFTRDALARVTSRPVVCVPHPIVLEPHDPAMRAKLGIPEHAFLVSTIFDFGSSFGRKNPLAAVQAFASAARSIPDAVLVVKTTGGGGDRGNVERLRAAIGESRVVVAEGRWPRAEISGLIAASNAFISLHRSEGFGLSIAEAILRRVPVVTTNWSGNVDFCDPRSTHLVSARLIPVRDPHPDYAALTDSMWADAEPEEAARHLVTIALQPEAARSRAEQAAAYLLDHLASKTYAEALAGLAAL